MSLVALVSSVLLFVVATFAWLTVSNIISVGDQNYVLGNLRYTLVEDPFISPSTIILPGDGTNYGTELLDTTISVTNNSTAPSQLRILVEYSEWTGTTHNTEVYRGGADEPFKAVFTTGFTCVGDYWYLYDGGNPVILDVNSGLLNIITSMYYDGEYAGIDYSNNSITVSITIEVKNASDTDWSQATLYTFKTIR